jgi:glycosidase
MHIIHDWVPNHWGVHHRLYESPPDRNWFHPELQTNYRGATLMDPHAFEVEKTGFTDGWFVPSMPDLNQRSQTLSNYLITNALWLIAETGLDGFRIDTYTYADQGFMRKFNERIKAANPQAFLFGEAWVYSAAMQAELINETGLDGICDFGTGFSFHEGLNEEEGWTEGLSRLYLNWSQDFLYDDPNFLVTFLDNHDMDRWRGRTPNDADARMGYALLLLGRGIPCVYYGSEWGWSSLSRPDGLVREDAFEALANPPEVENAWHELIRKLTTFRTEHPKLFAADFKHSIPKDGVYVQWRKAEQEGNREALFLLCNRGTEARADVWDRVPTGWSQGRDVMNGEALQRGESLEVQAGDFLAIYLTQ